MSAKARSPHSLNRIINTFYIVLIMLIIIFSLLFSSLTTSREIGMTTHENAENTLNDKYHTINKTFDQLFEQLVFLNNNPNLSDIINGKEGALKQAVTMNANIRSLYYRFQDVLSSVYININGGEFYFSGGAITQPLNAIDYTDFFAHTSIGAQYFWLDRTQNPFSTADEPKIAMGKTIGTLDSEANGVIIFNLKSDMILELLNDGHITENGGLFLISETGDSYPKRSTIPKAVLKHDKTGDYNLTINGMRYYTLSKKFELNDWRLMAVYPQIDLQNNRTEYLKFASILMLFLAIIGTIMTFGIGRLISKPIQQFATQIENTSITESHSALYLDKKYFKELSILYQSFNKMMLKNEQLMAKNQENMTERNKLEIELLQSQINPHFLYNTLYSIQSLSDLGMNKDAALMTRALADFYRQGISDSQILIDLRTEISHLQNYLTIMKYRYGDRFTYKITVVNDEILALKIPKISLQPVVENAIYHGMKETNELGLLLIELKEVSQGILITCKDNGHGIPDEKIVRINEEINRPDRGGARIVGIGLRSVNHRIKKYFGNDYGLWVEPCASGALIKIVIPKESYLEVQIGVK
ncbi:hypothetical protein Hs30E_04940 [Lactococcus hodotermopsidis]|uniref:Histidine kinase/HSP90-like ATPase domain-containing protein n=1 Tax=Pseudolactococcus hodotermopsidis TaxID=2709157 RepID=A0A6A0BBA5_9LACT|nr:sensor histidine kinase [Lactococcus hodotermopsidis]GFH41943.1 hypothetical protein Hs30E_04940 [Lactococcus hodotermopsidis]